jgi:chromosome segregation ATPase
MSREFADELLELYNQSLDQLAAELDVAKEGLEESDSKAKDMVRLANSLKEKIKTREIEFNQQVADHEAELAQLREDSADAIKKADICFQTLRDHFEKASQRVQGLETDLQEVRASLLEARAQVKSLEEANSTLLAQDAKHFDLYTKSQEEVDRLKVQLRAREDALRGAEKRLEAKLEGSSSRRYPRYRR